MKTRDGVWSRGFIDCLSYVVRVGDQDDYHNEKSLQDVAERLLKEGVTPPLNLHKTGVEDEGSFRRDNFISLFWGDHESFEMHRRLTTDELMTLNQILDSHDQPSRHP